MAKWLHVRSNDYISLDYVQRVRTSNDTGYWTLQYIGDSGGMGTVNGVTTYGSQADALAAIPSVLADSSNVVEG